MSGVASTTTAMLVGCGLVLATALAAQQPPAAATGQTPPRPTAAQVTGGGTAQYLVENPQVLHLTPVQAQRIRKVAARIDSTNAPVRAQLQQLTGGRAFRDLAPAERRRIAPQVQPLMQQLRANNEMSLDSVEAILTPAQTDQLETLRADYKERIAARRAAQPRSTRP